MATYVVGDVQGCYEPLRRVLDHVGFDPEHDQLWSVGDFVNRGPASLDVLRYFQQLGDAFVGVLGNHDLHLLAVMFGTRKPRGSDTFDPVLAAPDTEQLREWLRRRPLAHHARGHLMVHAGVVPTWTVEGTLRYAQEVQLTLTGPDAADYLREMYGNQPDTFDETLSGSPRLRTITNVLTRLRFCDASGRMDFDHKAGAERPPPGMLPWFAHWERRTADVPILFGHWAALEGRASGKNVHALDTGCVWGNRLTLMRLDDHRRFEWPCG